MWGKNWVTLQIQVIFCLFKTTHSGYFLTHPLMYKRFNFVVIVYAAAGFVSCLVFVSRGCLISRYGKEASWIGHFHVSLELF